MPQAMALAGCKHQTSKTPCRRCLVEKGDQLGDAEFDIVEHRRTSQSIIRNREDKAMCQRYGIGKPSPFEDPDLAFDITTGIPTECMHSELGYSKTLIGCLFEVLTGKYRSRLNARLTAKRNHWPWRCRKLKLSKDGNISATFSDASHVIQISPFLLIDMKPAAGRETMLAKDWLRPSMFTTRSRTEFESRLGSSFCKEIRKCFTLLAASNALVFAETRDSVPSSLSHMLTAIKNARMQIKKVWGDIVKLPNAHTALHPVDAADNYALATNV